MARPHRSDLSSDLLEDFRLDAAEQFPRCEQLLIELERAPKSTERLRELFRLIHTLKGNLGYVGLNHLMPLPQAMEDVLDALRERRIDGRLVLADVLWYAQDRFKPTGMIDLATLTGVKISALGNDIAALFSSDPALTDRLKAASLAGSKALPCCIQSSLSYMQKGHHKSEGLCSECGVQRL